MYVCVYVYMYVCMYVFTVRKCISFIGLAVGPALFKEDAIANEGMYVQKQMRKNS